MLKLTLEVSLTSKQLLRLLQGVITALVLLLTI